MPDVTWRIFFLRRKGRPLNTWRELGEVEIFEKKNLQAYLYKEIIIMLFKTRA